MSRAWCRGAEHAAAGAWVRHEPQQKSFVCCGFDDALYLREPETCGRSTNRSWTGFDQGRTGHYLNHAKGHACYCDAVGNTLASVSPRERWRWRPVTCELPTWDARRFCDLLGERTVLLLGDSTMDQAAITLMNLIHAGGGGCQAQISWDRHHDLVSPRGHRGEAWESVLRRMRPSILVASVGPHVESVEALRRSLERYRRGVDEHRQLLQSEERAAARRGGGARAAKRSFSAAWKTQQPGGCDPHAGRTDAPEHARPYTSPPTEAFYAAAVNTPPRASAGGAYRSHLPAKFNWANFSVYDAVASSVAREAGMPVLDLSPLYLRPDAHTRKPVGHVLDCLHLCLPGPLDLFAILMFQALANGEL